MRRQFPGFPAAAKRYWYLFSVASLGIGALVTFTGAIAGLIVLAFLPEAIWFFALAAVSLVFHSAAFATRIIGDGAYDPDQTTFSSPVTLLATVVLLGAVTSTLLLIATSGAYVAREVLGWSPLAGAVIAAYYPVLDVALERRGWWTPASIVYVCILIFLSTVLNVHRSVIESFPVFYSQRRPQS